MTIDIKQIYRNQKRLFGVIIELTRQCNFSCIHCYIDDYSEAGLPTDRIIKLLYELRDNGVYEIQFTGGEVFLREDIFTILEAARDLQFRVVILSNISLLDDDKIKRLDDLHVEVVSTTLFSLDDKLNDAITSSKNSATKVKQNILKIAKTNVIPEIKTVVMSANCREVPAIWDFCKKNNIRFVATEGLFPSEFGSIAPLKLAMTNEQLEAILPLLDKIRFGGPYVLERNADDSICCELNYSLFISANGDVYPCNLFFRRIGNINKNSINEIWHSPFLKELQNRKWSELKKCNNCSQSEYCIRCSGTTYSNCLDYLACDIYACRTASIRSKLYKSNKRTYCNRKEDNYEEI